MNTIRAKVDHELTRRVGTWFTVREIQDKLKINPSTLKPLIMKYARENLLKRRQVKGTARSVEFSPAASTENSFRDLLARSMPYRAIGNQRPAPQKKAAAKGKAAKAAPKKATKKTSKRK